MKTLTPERVREIAAQEARNMASVGSPGADDHNTKTIAFAIQVALEDSVVRPDPPAIDRDTQFKESGHSEVWKDQVGADLNTLMTLLNPNHTDNSDQAILRIVQRVAEFEEIEKA